MKFNDFAIYLQVIIYMINLFTHNYINFCKYLKEEAKKLRKGGERGYNEEIGGGRLFFN